MFQELYSNYDLFLEKLQNYPIDIEYIVSSVGYMFQNVAEFIATGIYIVKNNYSIYYSNELMSKIIILYCVAVTLSNVWLFSSRNNKIINVYFNNDKSKKGLSNNDKNDITLQLKNKIFFFKERLDKISAILESDDGRSCKKLSLIRSEIIKKYRSNGGINEEQHQLKNE
jgi:hypothetical protein